MLSSLIRKTSVAHPHDPAFVYNDQFITWTDLFNSIKSFETRLANLIGKRVLLYMQDGSFKDFVALLAVCSEVPIELILISSFHTEARAKELLTELKGDLLIKGENGKIETVLEGRRHDRTERPPESIICLLTSGTTGTPKCAAHTWERLSSGITVRERYEGKRWLSTYHVSSFAGTQVMLQSLFNKGCLIIPENGSHGESALEALLKHKANYLNCTPTYMRKLLMAMKPGLPMELQSITLGGEIVDQSLIDLIKSKIPAARVTHIYASTELGANIEVKDEKEGFPVQIIDGKTAKIEDGELFLRPSGRSMIGYLDHEPLHTPADSWVATRDLVEIHGDRVIFLGRKDHLMNIAGFKVNAGVVESVIRTVPNVVDVAVKAKKNTISGNLVFATVQLAHGTDPEAAKQKIIETCKAKLPYYAVPRVFDFVAELKVNANFKLVR